MKFGFSNVHRVPSIKNWESCALSNGIRFFFVQTALADQYWEVLCFLTYSSANVDINHACLLSRIISCDFFYKFYFVSLRKRQWLGSHSSSNSSVKSDGTLASLSPSTESSTKDSAGILTCKTLSSRLSCCPLARRAVVKVAFQAHARELLFSAVVLSSTIFFSWSTERIKFSTALPVESLLTSGFKKWAVCELDSMSDVLSPCWWRRSRFVSCLNLAFLCLASSSSTALCIILLFLCQHRPRTLEYQKNLLEAWDRSTATLFQIQSVRFYFLYFILIFWAYPVD